MKAPFPKSWWVEPDLLLAGCYPGDPVEANAADKLERLLEAGIRCVISLQEPDEMANGAPFEPYTELLNALAREKGTEIACVGFPIRDNDVPDVSRMRRILSGIQGAIREGRKVYVHCWGGHGRTGTVIGCWLREQGLSGEEALARIRNLRARDEYLSRQPAPQTAEQRRFVLEWRPTGVPESVARAQGCILGQLAGDALGSLVEFQRPEAIRRRYPHGVREMHDGGTWDTIAGQPTDDSEMALGLARTLLTEKTYRPDAAQKSYVDWLASGPFDCGATISTALRGGKNPDSQANGAMMRISPLGIFGAYCNGRQVAMWARADAGLTHPNPVCLDANALYAMAIAQAIRTGAAPNLLYQQVLRWAEEMAVAPTVLEAAARAAESPPADYLMQQGWVLIAFQNALWQLLHASTLEEGVVDTIMRGGDTDTNAAICGALLGAVRGRDAVPEQWTARLLRCRPKAGTQNVRRPRPECYWPTDVLNVAEELLDAGRQHGGQVAQARRKAKANPS